MVALDPSGKPFQPLAITTCLARVPTERKFVGIFGQVLQKYDASPIMARLSSEKNDSAVLVEALEPSWFCR